MHQLVELCGTRNGTLHPTESMLVLLYTSAPWRQWKVLSVNQTQWNRVIQASFGRDISPLTEPWGVGSGYCNHLWVASNKCSQPHIMALVCVGNRFRRFLSPTFLWISCPQGHNKVKMIYANNFQKLCSIFHLRNTWLKRGPKWGKPLAGRPNLGQPAHQFTPLLHHWSRGRKHTHTALEPCIWRWFHQQTRKAFSMDPRSHLHALTAIVQATVNAR